MHHPRKANDKPHDKPRKILAMRRKAARRFARGLPNALESIRA